MKIREQVTLALLIMTAAWAAWMTVSTSHLRAELTALRATHQRLQESRQAMRQGLLKLAASRGAADQEFRRVLAVLEADGGADIIVPNAADTTRINTAPGILIR